MRQSFSSGVHRSLQRDDLDEILWIDRLKLIRTSCGIAPSPCASSERGCRTASDACTDRNRFRRWRIRARGADPPVHVLLRKRHPFSVPVTPIVKLAQTFCGPEPEPDRFIFDFTRHRSFFSVVLPGVDLATDARLRSPSRRAASGQSPSPC